MKKSQNIRNRPYNKTSTQNEINYDYDYYPDSHSSSIKSPIYPLIFDLKNSMKKYIQEKQAAEARQGNNPGLFNDSEGVS